MNRVFTGVDTDVDTDFGPATTNLAEATASEDLPLLQVDRSVSTRNSSVVKPFRWIVFLVAVLAAAGWLASRRWTEDLSDKASKNASNPITTRVAKVVSLGRLEPKGEVIAVAAPSGSSDARVQSLLVEVGDLVETGQVLAVLDNNESLRTEEVVAQAQLEQARARLAQSRVIVSSTYTQLLASLESLRSQRETARSDVHRQKQLRRSNALSEQEYEATLLNLATADKAVVEAEAKLSRYTDKPEDSVDMNVAHAEVRVAEAALQSASVAMEHSYVRAPITGKVLAIDLRPGERIGQQALLRMGQTDAMMVRAEVYESDISLIRTGQEATVHARALRTPLVGVVEHVATLVQRQSIVDSDPAAHTEARVVEVLVRIKPEFTAQAAGFVGMQVMVEFPL